MFQQDLIRRGVEPYAVRPRNMARPSDSHARHFDVTLQQVVFRLARLAPLFDRYRLAFTLLAALFVASGGAALLIGPAYRPLARWLLGG